MARNKELLEVFIGLPKPSRGVFKIYIPSVRESEYKGKKYLWPSPWRYPECIETENGVRCLIPRGQLFIVQASYDSAKHTRDYHYFLAIALPRPRYEARIKLVEYDYSRGESNFPVENAQILADYSIVNDEELAKQYLLEGYSLSKNPLKRFENLLAYKIKKLREELGKNTSQEEEKQEEKGEEEEYIIIDHLVTTPENLEKVREILAAAARQGLAYKTPEGRLALNRRVYEKLVELAVPA